MNSEFLQSLDLKQLQQLLAVNSHFLDLVRRVIGSKRFSVMLHVAIDIPMNEKHSRADLKSFAFLSPEEIPVEFNSFFDAYYTRLLSEEQLICAAISKLQNIAHVEEKN